MPANTDIPASLQRTLASIRLSESDYHDIVDGLGRRPNDIELAIFSAMWSEHCSYRTTRRFLKRLPGDSPDVVCGPGENAGAVRISDKWVAAFKMESHNHPSMIESYNGAATGIGGILRDIFSLGARPVAISNSLRFGDLNHGGMPALVQGVVAGIAGYGNSFGVPTITGETVFSPSYNQNILVNALALGVMRSDLIIHSAAPGHGHRCFYIGSPTGLDGVHGAAMASRAFGENGQEASRTTVQVGDPFAGKRLMEACLEANSKGWIAAMQDMGAAGIISSSVEMAAKAGTGLEIDLSEVPLRDSEMTPGDILLSESQERMLVFPVPEHENDLCDLFRSCDLEAVAIGRTIKDPVYRVFWKNRMVAEAPVSLIAEAPEGPALAKTNVPSTNSNQSRETRATAPMVPMFPGKPLYSLANHLSFSAKETIWQQYDWLVQGRTLRGPPAGGCSLISIDEAGVCLALSSQGSHRHTQLAPRSGSALIAARAWLDVAITGARPLAFTDNLNFGSPEDSKVMDDFAASIEGLRDAALALSCPFISGNVSLYNQTDGKSIPPTPVLAALGVMDQDDATRTGKSLVHGLSAVLIGTPPESLAGSWITEDQAGADHVTIPPPNWPEVRNCAKMVQELRHNGTVLHASLATNGVLAALIRMALRQKLGIRINADSIAANESSPDSQAFWYGDTGLPVILVTDAPKQLAAAARRYSIPCVAIGQFDSDSDALICSHPSLRTLFTGIAPALPLDPDGTTRHNLGHIRDLSAKRLPQMIPGLSE